ncbi:MAG: hypothetical protein R6V62_04000 [Candidatus Fermentibacteraceae bacterium]
MRSSESSWTGRRLAKAGIEALGNTAWNKAKAARLLGPGYWA